MFCYYDIVNRKTSSVLIYISYSLHEHLGTHKSLMLSWHSNKYQRGGVVHWPSICFGKTYCSLHNTGWFQKRIRTILK